MAKTTITVEKETADLFKEFIGDSGVSVPQATRSLLYAAIDMVNHEIMSGRIPEMAKMRTQSKEYEPSRFLIFLAMYYKEVGIISEEDFNKHIDNLAILIQANALDFVPEKKIVSPSKMTDQDIELYETEIKLMRLTTKRDIGKFTRKLGM